MSQEGHQTTLAVKEFAERGATVIVMTDSELSPVSKWASLQFVVPIGWPAVFGSRCSGLMVVEGLTIHIANLLEDSLAERITNAMRLAKNFESFSHERSQRKLLKNGIPWHHVKKGGKNRK